MRESLSYDVVIVGAGPSGLACAIHLKQLNASLKVCILEKGAYVGAHLLSGAVLELRSLKELFPEENYIDILKVPALKDEFCFLTKNKKIPLPLPNQMKNTGNYIISLGEFCQWLASQAESLGVDIFPGFAATDILLEKNKIKGVITGDKGRDKLGNETPRFQVGMNLYAKHTVFAEGCHGSLTKKVIELFQLRKNKAPQTYGLGIKELWEVDSPDYSQGKVFHSVGWPLDFQTYGGSFIYHLSQHHVAVGFVVGLDYSNPYLDPFEEFQRFKTHPKIKSLFKSGKRLCYGARALCEGGLQSIPLLTMPGALIVGDAAGFLNVPKIKGNHTAMKSGILAACALQEAILACQEEATKYTTLMHDSWLWKELYDARNIRPGFRFGLIPGLIYAALDTYLLKGRAPWTFSHKQDSEKLKPAKQCKKIIYPKPDNQITFDKLTSVYLSNLRYEENQICHLQLHHPEIAISKNLKIYDSPETRYCPAGVYEILLNQKKGPYLQINASNCIQCKTCDIKDPYQNINWVPPEGGDGPHYLEM